MFKAEEKKKKGKREEVEGEVLFRQDGLDSYRETGA
jgi:hypothetical protein